MVAVLRDYVAIDGRWYARGMSREQVGADASAIGAHAWVDAEEGSASGEAPAPASPAEQPEQPEQPESGVGSDVPAGEPEQGGDEPTDEGGEGGESVPRSVAAGGEVGVPAAVAEGAGAEASADEAGLGSEAPPEVSPESSGDALEAPPRAGRGSSEQAWRDYASTVGVELSGFETRNEIIEKVESAAGKPA